MMGDKTEQAISEMESRIDEEEKRIRDEAAEAIYYPCQTRMDARAKAALLIDDAIALGRERGRVAAATRLDAANARIALLQAQLAAESQARADVLVSLERAKPPPFIERDNAGVPDDDR